MSSNKIVIRPREGSARFRKATSISGVSLVEETLDEMGRPVVSQKGEYKSERLPNTRGFRRPMYHGGKRRWGLVLDNGEDADQEWVNRMVKECRFRYEGNNRRSGDLIETADLYDVDDPFFNHSMLDYMHEEGVHTMDMDDPKYQILAAGDRASRDVAREKSNVYATNVRFLMVSTEQDTVVASKAIQKKIAAYALFSKMGVNKKRLVLKILKNRDISDSADEDTLNTELGGYIDNTSRTTASGRTFMEEFVHVAGLDQTRMEIKNRVQRGLRSSYIKRQQGQFIFYGKPVGKSQEEVEAFFFRAENAEEYDRLLIKLGDGAD